VSPWSGLEWARPVTPWSCDLTVEARDAMILRSDSWSGDISCCIFWCPASLPLSLFLSVPYPMDQKSVKTPNPKWRLHWCLIEFIDWRYSQSCWYFRPLVWTSAPLTFSLVHISPFPVWISTWAYIHTVCNRGEEGGVRGASDRKHLPPSTFIGQFLKKPTFRVWGVFIDIWSMLYPLKFSTAVAFFLNKLTC
jgi:hypothetical protein